MVSLSAASRTCGAILGLALLIGAAGLAFREMTSRDGEENRRFALTLAPGDGPRIEAPPDLAEPIAAAYHGVFHGTVYYTVLESAFSPGSGFDLTETTRPGLGGKKFPRDFLKAVEMEGFGRMKTPVDGKLYVSSCRGQWGYARAPLDSCGQPLQALRSTAVGADYEMVHSQASFRVTAAGLPTAFLEARWLVCDTGSGLKPCQIDFYWGEDAPMGPGSKLSRPRGMPDAIVNPSVLVLAK